MFRQFSAAVFLCALTVAGAPALATTVERSGTTYHVAACGGPMAAGHAQCHAHFVTDDRGNSLVNRFTTHKGAAALSVPTGLGPAALISASTGDRGYSGGPSFPATTPTVTAVGGTSLASANNARGWAETAWSGSGSGCSAVYPKPAWQTFIPNCLNRMEADISAVADPNTGVAVYGPATLSISGWMVFGGTSVSAPLVGGLYAAGGAVPGPGGVYSGVAQFNDVTSGANGKCAVSFFCTARTGYDGPTGLGTPNGPGAFCSQFCLLRASKQRPRRFAEAGRAGYPRWAMTRITPVQKERQAATRPRVRNWRGHSVFTPVA